MDELVRLQGVRKSFPQGGQAARLGALWKILRGVPRTDSVPVLEGIDLSVRRGESVGLVGDNGAGKSTILKVLSGVLTPTSGKVTVRARIGALLELGAGFHPDYTGRENLRLSAALAGLSPAGIRSAEPAIEVFADIGTAMDEPIRHYSSGMVVRLGFAVITATRPELLITDEVLAVGDESFQRKCLRWIEDYIAGGGTLMLVSHSPDAVRRLCRRAYWIENGRVRAHGEAGEVVDAYLVSLDERERQRQAAGFDEGSGLYRVVSFAVDGRQDARLEVEPGPVRIAIEAHSPDQRAPVLAVGLRDWHGTPVYGVTTEIDAVEPVAVSDHRFQLDLEVDLSPLEPGTYSVSAHVLDPEGLRLFDTRTLELRIRGDCRDRGYYRAAVRALDRET